MPDELEMTCKELVEVVTEYLEGTLPPAECRRFEEHLQDCPACRIYISQMRYVIQTLGRLNKEALPEPALQVLLHVFRDWKRELPANEGQAPDSGR